MHKLAYFDGLRLYQRYDADENGDDPPAGPGEWLDEGRPVKGLRGVLDEELLVALRDREVEVDHLGADRRHRELGRGDVNLVAGQHS